MRFRRLVALSLAGSALFVPCLAEANAGTPLMWATAFYLLIGNALIGVVEGAIIVRYFQTAVRRTVTLAILANYVSCVAGLFAMALVSGADVGLRSLWAGLWAFLAAVAFAFAVTVVLEWPFALLALPPERRRWRLAFRATLLAQGCSYVLLSPFCLWVSPLSLYTSASIRRDASFARPPLAQVYFIEPVSGDVVRVRTDGTGRRLVFDGEFTDFQDRLVAMSALEGGWQIRVARHGTAADVVLTGTDMEEVVLEEPGVRNRYRPLYSAHGFAADFREDQPWQARCGWWPGEGLSVRNDGGFYRRVALETPGASWMCRAPTVLPSGQVVFQLGPNIVLYDPDTSEIAQLAVGQGPVVVVPSQAP